MKMIIGGKFNTDKFSTRRRCWIDIDSHIVDCSTSNANELALGAITLKMQTTQNSILRPRVVVLNERQLNSGVTIARLLVALHEKAALIAKHLGLNNQNARQLGLDNIHFEGPATNRLARYWP